MIYQSNYTDRQLYNQARVAMLSAMPTLSQTAYDNAVKTSMALTLIQPIATGNQILEFPVLQNQTGAGNPTRPDETRLPQQNAFFVGQVYVTLFKGTGYSYVSNTYPNTVTYTNAANYYVIYNGIMKITVDQSVLTRRYSMRKFLNIPQTQLTAASNSPQDQFDGTAMLPWEPNIVFTGTAQIEVQIILPASAGTLDANSFVRVDMYGIEAQNVCLGAVQ